MEHVIVTVLLSTTMKMLIWWNGWSLVVRIIVKFYERLLQFLRILYVILCVKIYIQLNN